MEEKDIKILENYICGNKETMKEMLVKAIEKLLKAYKELEQENKELKEDIKNMYSEEVVISIISDEFNLTRSEVLNLLGESEE